MKQVRQLPRKNAKDRTLVQIGYGDIVDDDEEPAENIADDDVANIIMAHEEEEI